MRGLADKARAALDELEMKVKLTWSDDLKIAYNQIVSEDGDTKRPRSKSTKAQKSAGGNGLTQRLWGRRSALQRQTTRPTKRTKTRKKPLPKRNAR